MLVGWPVVSFLETVSGNVFSGNVTRVEEYPTPGPVQVARTRLPGPRSRLGIMGALERVQSAHAMEYSNKVTMG